MLLFESFVRPAGLSAYRPTLGRMPIEKDNRSNVFDVLLLTDGSFPIRFSSRNGRETESIAEERQSSVRRIGKAFARMYGNRRKTDEKLVGIASSVTLRERYSRWKSNIAPYN